MRKHWDDRFLHWFTETIFSTLTNVNFNKEHHLLKLKDGAEIRDIMRKKYNETVV